MHDALRRRAYIGRMERSAAASPYAPSSEPLTLPAVAAAGYSGTPLPKKLGIKPGHRVLLLSAPEPFEASSCPTA